MKKTSIILVIILLISYNVKGNFIINGGFEIDNCYPFNKPDHFRFADPNYQSIDDNAHSGNYCALFNCPIDSNQTNIYYYALYDASGNPSYPNFLDVSYGEEYELSIYIKTDSNFSGLGISIQLIFCDDNSQMIGQINSKDFKSENNWTKIRIQGKIPCNISKITAGVYYHGKGRAWVDDFSLVKVSDPLGNNLDFEKYTLSPYDKPDFFRPRSLGYDYLHVEKNINYTYKGMGAANYNNTTASLFPLYFYGLYSKEGDIMDPIPVCPGDSYRIKAFGRTDNNFNGSGIMISGIFWDKNNQFVDRTNTNYEKSTVWKPFELNLSVPPGATGMTYSIEYDGSGKAWFDELALEKMNLVKNSGFEADNSNPISKPDYWRIRFGSNSPYELIENNLQNVYQGEKCALFDNQTDSTQICYFYGPYDETGIIPNYLSVLPGENYKLEVETRDSNFIGDVP